jgi:hypothetical protein
VFPRLFPDLQVRPDPASSATGRTSGSTTPSRTPSPRTASDLPTGGPVPDAFSPSSVSSSPDGNLYAIGYAACDQTPCTSSMVRSTDQGRTWVGLPSPKSLVLSDRAALPTRNALVSVREVRFATSRDGFAFGGSLWVTHDAAASWTQVPLPDQQQVLDLAVSGDQAWMVVAACPDATSPCSSTRLLRMDVRGGSPTVESSVRLPGGIRSARLQDGAGSLTLVVHGIGPQATPVTQTWLLRANSSWRALPASPCGEPPAGADPLTGASALVPTADGSGTLFGFCSYQGEGGQTVTTSVSQDDGRTWRTVGDELRADADDRPVFTAGSGQTVLVAGVSAGALVSADGGRTYQRTSSPTDEVFTWIGSAGAATVYALAAESQQGIYLSDDGGSTFVRRSIRPTARTTSGSSATSG